MEESQKVWIGKKNIGTGLHDICNPTATGFENVRKFVIECLDAI